MRRRRVVLHMDGEVRTGDHADTDVMPKRLDAFAALQESPPLAEAFAPRPGVAANAYRVEHLTAGDLIASSVEHFTEPVAAWRALRAPGAGSAVLISSAGERERVVATRRPTGEVEMRSPDELCLDGPDPGAAALQWEQFSAGQPTAAASEAVARDKEPERSARSEPPEAATVRSSLRRLVEERRRAATAADTEPEAVATAGSGTTWTEVSSEAADVDGNVGASTAAPERAMAADVEPSTDRSAQLGPVRCAEVALALACLLGCFVFVRFTMDAAWIPWRYGQTFVHTGHWNWNRTGPGVEAYSAFLYAALSVVPALLRIPTELFFKVVSFALLAGYVVWARSLRLPRRQRVLLLAAALATPVFYVQLFSGLATVSFALLITLLYSRLYRAGRLTRLDYAIALGVALSRPEGVVVAGVAVVWALVIDRSRRHVVGAVAFAAAWAVYWAWRWWHFGWFWPNPFYISASTRGAVAHELPAVAGGAIAVVVVAAAAVAATTLWLRRRGESTTPAMLAAMTPVVLCTAAAAVVLGLYRHSDVGIDVAGRLPWQLLFPVVAVALSRPLTSAVHPVRVEASDVWAFVGLGGAGLTAAVYGGSSFLNKGPAEVAVLVVAAGVAWQALWRRPVALAATALGIAVAIAWISPAEMAGWAAYRYRLQDAHQAMAETLHAAHIDGAVAIGDAGVLPFELHQRVVDLDGVATASIAHGHFDTAELARQHVRFVVAMSTVPDPSGEWTPTIGQRVTYDTVRFVDGFWFSAGPAFSGGYLLNFWIDPALEREHPDLLDKLKADARHAAVHRTQSNAGIFGDHLFDFPFL